MKGRFILLSLLAFVLASIVCKANPPTQSLSFQVEQSVFVVDSSVTQSVTVEAVVNPLSFLCEDPVDYGISLLGYQYIPFKLQYIENPGIRLITEPVDYGIIG